MASTPKFYDRVLMDTTTTGTGTLTLGSAIAGYQAWSVLGNSNSAYYYLEAVDSGGIPTGDWEVGIGTYTSSGTTLSRTVILASSNSGSAVSLSAGTKRVSLIAQPAALAQPSLEMGGRLTLTTAVPVTTTDVTGATTVYYTPYKHNKVSLWNGSGWVRYAFAEVSLALGTLASATIPQDVFLYDNAGTLTLEFLIWTNVTTRATALVMQDGVLCKTGALTRRYLGTFRPTATTTTEDSVAKRLVWNYENQVERELFVKDSTRVTNPYSTDGYQQADAVATNQVEIVTGLAGSSWMDLSLVASFGLDATSNSGASVAIGEDSTSTPHAKCHVSRYVSAAITAIGVVGNVSSFLRIQPPLGYHAYVWLESGTGSGTTTWNYTRVSGTIDFVSGMSGFIRG